MMDTVEILKGDIEFIQKYYFDELEFDLTDSKNIGHSFYDNYQLFLKLDSNSEEAKHVFLNYLFGVIEYLEAIKERSKKKYDDIRNRLITNKSVGLYGDLFELYIAWTLVQKNIEFDTPKPPSPDFEIGKISIETASCQFHYNKKPSIEDFSLKIRETLIDKMRKPYAIPTTALFVDITNLCFHSKKLNDILTKDYLKNILVDATDASKAQNNFGLISFFYSNTSKKNKGENGYACNIFDVYENRNADYNLVSFLKNSIITVETSNEEEIMQYNH